MRQQVLDQSVKQEPEKDKARKDTSCNVSR
jgi:hypothetical protein